MLKKILRIIIIYLIFTLSINIIVFSAILLEIEPINDFYKNGKIVTFPKFKYAMVFAHGSESLVKNNDSLYIAHLTHMNGKIYTTKFVMDTLKSKGYTKVWTDMCETGNSDYMLEYANGSKVEWYDWISRNRKRGYTLPVFNGFWITRIVIPERMIGLFEF